MKIFRSLAELPANFGQSVVTIGNFDGVHCGHRAVLSRVKQRAQMLGARSIVVTFSPHPARILRPQSTMRLITPEDVKLDLLAAAGVDATLVLDFTPEFSRWSARQFAETVLKEALNAVEVLEGENFHFGHGAEGGVASLQELGLELGFGVEVFSPLMYGGTAVSSSRIRSCIAAGDMHSTRHLLGRVFSVHSTPAPGRGYGSRYTVPTINLAPYAELLPDNGVYVTEIVVNGETFQSVTNVGNRPTFGVDSFAVETHILNFHPMELSETTPLELSFLLRLREEKKWDSPEALRAQIGRDVGNAQRFFSLRAKLPSKTR
jgi:riboflavin kinase / FMN adenylyltransferase